MSLNSAVTQRGEEIGRAQFVQSQAAMTPARVEMNPVLLKPTSDLSSQVVVMGRPWEDLSAVSFQERKRELFPVVLGALENLAADYDVIILEGAGSPAEINLLEGDIVNLALAKRLDISAILVGDIDRGGVLAHILGTQLILPPELGVLLKGFVVNKFRGDHRLLQSGVNHLVELTGLSHLGTLPYRLINLPEEDSLGLEHVGAKRRTLSQGLRIGIVRLPKISNFTDYDPFQRDPGVEVVYLDSPQALGAVDLLILPGSKSTLSDLAWLRERGFEEYIAAFRQSGGVILGVCAGYQMMGEEIQDGVESKETHSKGLGLLEAQTRFSRTKVTVARRGHSLCGSEVRHEVDGYQIHQGRVTYSGGTAWFVLEDGELEGAVSKDGLIFGTTLHGLFDRDQFRKGFLSYVATRCDKSYSSSYEFEAEREEAFDELAELVADHVDMDLVMGLLRELRI